MKEELCYVSLDYMRELLQAKASAAKPVESVKLYNGVPSKYLHKTSSAIRLNENKNLGMDWEGKGLRQYFVLPDYSSIMKGYVKPEGQPPQVNEQVPPPVLVVIAASHGAC